MKSIEYPLVVDGSKRGALVLPHPLDLTEADLEWVWKQLDAIKVLLQARARYARPSKEPTSLTV